MTPLVVIGDSITYLAAKHGAVSMFEDAGYTATLDGARGQRADNPLRAAAWVNAAYTTSASGVGVYALGANDLMGETFKDPDEPAFSVEETAALVSTLMERLHFGSFFFDRVVWVNITTGTLNGHFNKGARTVNAEMALRCEAAGFGYARWDEKDAPTSDLIHQKIAGTPLWVDAIVEAAR